MCPFSLQSKQINPEGGSLFPAPNGVPTVLGLTSPWQVSLITWDSTVPECSGKPGQSPRPCSWRQPHLMCPSCPQSVHCIGPALCAVGQGVSFQSLAFLSASLWVPGHVQQWELEHPCLEGQQQPPAWESECPTGMEGVCAVLLCQPSWASLRAGVTDIGLWGLCYSIKHSCVDVVSGAGAWV
ncbi:nuclear fragile X mental retardation-interacting protein 2-like [Platysternon megacephalum]|uniref:Nuclear fragile X mental retardation-interacting protein 2-like n=1 Tax=Platysternon megacephalum TaxID=55544 RepID=A0A4D9DM29_9SAUR|nr:nuclear fragile X mental retardation-interacting protein 2-like [Platysternon megacephalum]